MRDAWSNWRRRQAKQDAAAYGVTIFERAEADTLVELTKQSLGAMDEAMDEYKLVSEQAAKHGQAAAECQEQANASATTYNRAIDEGADERIKAAAWKAAADAWEAAAAAGRKEAESCDAAAAASWKIAAAASAYMHTTEMAVIRADEMKSEVTGIEKKAWAGRAKTAREWEKSARELSQPRLEYALEHIPMIYRSAARAHAWAAAAKARADLLRDDDDQPVG